MKGTPFAIADVPQFERARAMYGAVPKRPGWLLEILESLGLLRLPAGNIGGCIGCYFNEIATRWILGTFLKTYSRGSLAFFVQQEVALQCKLNEDLTPNYDTVVITPESGRTLVRIAETLLARPELKLVAVYATTATNQGLFPHSIMLSFRKIGDVISIFWTDPHGWNESSDHAVKHILLFLEYNGPEGVTYVAERSACIRGPQLMETKRIGEEESENEPGGYCLAWTSLALIVTFATGGAHPDEIYKELTDAFGTNPARAKSFIRTVTKNMAALMRDRLKMDPVECKLLHCCAEIDYCTLAQTVTLGGSEYILDDECFHPPGNEYTALGKHLFTSKNGTHWLEYGEEGMIGLRLSRPDQNPAWKREFDVHVERQMLAAEHSVGPKIAGAWSCLKGASDPSGAVAYNITCLEVKQRLTPIKNLLGSGFRRFSVSDFVEFGRRASLTLRGLLNPDSVYSFPDPDLQVHFLLDLDLAVPETPPLAIQNEYEALLDRIPGLARAGGCTVC
jgi:hypothetical protein